MYADESTGQGPLAGIGLETSLDEHDFEIVPIESEDDNVDRQCGSGKFVTVGRGACLGHNAAIRRFLEMSLRNHEHRRSSADGGHGGLAPAQRDTDGGA